MLCDIGHTREEAKALGFEFLCHEPHADPYRIVMGADFLNMSGKELYDELCGYNIYCEFHDDQNVILMPSINNKTGDFEQLTAALKNIYAKKTQRSTNTKIQYQNSKSEILNWSDSGKFEFQIPSKALPLRDAVFAPKEWISTKDSIGRIASEPAAVYPPGIPLIIPGELISEEIAVLLSRAREKIAVVKEFK